MPGPRSIQYRLTLLFFNALGAIVAGHDFTVSGQSPDWTGDLATSPFQKRNESVQVPADAVRIQIGLASGGGAEVTGTMIVDDLSVRAVTADSDRDGMKDADEVLAGTDVLTWWGHAAHSEVSDEVVERVHRHVLSGLGLVVLHSGHWSKIFVKLMGTTCTLRWRSEHDRELVWTVNPTHPIANGVPHPLVIDEDEMYGEFFDIPVPDEVIFLSTFSGGEVFRSGCTFRRGHGKIFYFRPGDQDYPTYHHKDVRRVIANGVRWATSDRPERAYPELLRYDTDVFFAGRSHSGPMQ